MDGAQAGPRKIGHATGGDLCRFRCAGGDPAAARALGHTDDGVRQQLSVVVVESGVDQRGDEVGDVGFDAFDRGGELLVAA